VRDVASLDDVHAWRAQSRAVHVEPKVLRYIVDIVAATRAVPDGARAVAAFIERGASPRATLAIANMARSRAALDGRDYAIPTTCGESRRCVAPPHRISLPARARGRAADAVVAAVVAAVPVP